jgi:hypothetical protein
MYSTISVYFECLKKEKAYSWIFIKRKGVNIISLKETQHEYPIGKWIV